MLWSSEGRFPSRGNASLASCGAMSEKRLLRCCYGRRFRARAGGEEDNRENSETAVKGLWYPGEFAWTAHDVHAFLRKLKGAGLHRARCRAFTAWRAADSGSQMAYSYCGDNSPEIVGSSTARCCAPLVPSFVGTPRWARAGTHGFLFGLTVTDDTRLWTQNRAGRGASDIVEAPRVQKACVWSGELHGHGMANDQGRGVESVDMARWNYGSTETDRCLQSPQP
ncbi:hypothetical protein VTK26DRAFT_2101 [Humicola hyalothermophila]